MHCTPFNKSYGHYHYQLKWSVCRRWLRTELKKINKNVYFLYRDRKNFRYHWLVFKNPPVLSES